MTNRVRQSQRQPSESNAVMLSREETDAVILRLRADLLRSHRLMHAGVEIAANAGLSEADVQWITRP